MLFEETETNIVPEEIKMQKKNWFLKLQTCFNFVKIKVNIQLANSLVFNWYY